MIFGFVIGNHIESGYRLSGKRKFIVSRGIMVFQRVLEVRGNVLYESRRNRHVPDLRS